MQNLEIKVVWGE